MRDKLSKFLCGRTYLVAEDRSIINDWREPGLRQILNEMHSVALVDTGIASLKEQQTVMCMNAYTVVKETKDWITS